MKIENNLLRHSILLIGTITISLAGINWHVGIAAWFAPILLLIFVRNASRKEFLFFVLAMVVAGAISQSGNNLLKLPQVTIINGVMFGILTSIPYLLDRLINRDHEKFFQTLIFPASVTLIEFIASYLIGTWGSISHTQHGFKSLLQIVSVTGIYGVWFIISWNASVFIWVLENRTFSRRIKKGLVIYGTIICVVFLYGITRLQMDSTPSTYKLATVCGEVNTESFMDDFQKLVGKSYSQIPNKLFSDSTAINTIKKNTIKAINQGAELVVWSEIALILTEDQKNELLKEMQALCVQQQAFILMTCLEENKNEGKKPFNNLAVFVTPDSIAWQYSKSYLQPTAEKPIINSGDFNIPVLETKFGIVGSAICADLDMQQYIKQVGDKMVDVLLVPAYDWEEITPLHSQMAAVQAIQFGCNIVRANGKGVSAIYDFKGREIVAFDNTKLSQKLMYGELPFETPDTVYKYVGDILPGLCFVFLLGIVILQLRKDKTKNTFSGK